MTDLSSVSHGGVCFEGVFFFVCVCVFLGVFLCVCVCVLHKTYTE